MRIFKYLNKNMLNKNDTNSLITSRSSTIVYNLLDKEFKIYNGKEFKNIKFIESQLDKKTGDFVITRKLCKHSKPKRKNKIRIKKNNV